MTHELKPTEYLYKGHTITLDNTGTLWLVHDNRFDPALFSSPSIDDCMTMIDGVMDEVEP